MKIAVIRWNTTILEDDLKRNFDAFYSNFHVWRVCRWNITNIEDWINGYCERSWLHYEIQEMTKKEIKSIATAHQNVDRRWVTTRVALTPFDGRVTVSDERVEMCKQTIERLKMEMIASIHWKLVFVWMWMDHNVNDIGNYRIRTYVKNKAGRKFFIELWNGRAAIKDVHWKEVCSQIHIDFLVDQDEADYYDKQLQEVCRTPFRQMTSTQKAIKDHFLKQPYYQYKKHEARAFVEWKEANKQNVIDLVNYLFDTNFTEMIVDSIILRQEDYISTDI